MTIGKAPRTKLFVDKSRIWNLDEPAAGETSNPNMNIRYMMIGYIWNIYLMNSMFFIA